MITVLIELKYLKRVFGERFWATGVTPGDALGKYKVELAKKNACNFS